MSLPSPSPLIEKASQRHSTPPPSSNNYAVSAPIMSTAISICVVVAYGELHIGRQHYFWTIYALTPSLQPELIYGLEFMRPSSAFP